MAELTRDELRGNDVMASGTIDYANIKENIRLIPADVPEAIDQFLRITDYGFLSLYKAPDQDVHWEDTNSDEVVLTTSQQEIVSVTPNLELNPNDTSIQVSGEISNSKNQIQYAYIQVLLDGVEHGLPREIQMESNQKDRIFAFSTQLVNTYPANTVVSVNIYADQNGNLTLGDILTPVRLKITKAQAAPVIMQVGLTENITLGHGSNAKTLHIVDGRIINIT